MVHLKCPDQRMPLGDRMLIYCTNLALQQGGNLSSHDVDVVQTSSQPLPQPLFAGMPAPRRSTDEERTVQQPGASAPFYSLQPPQEVTRNSL